MTITDQELADLRSQGFIETALHDESRMTTIAELEAKLTALQAELAALKAQPDEIDWNDPKWVGRLVECWTGDEWQLHVCTGGDRHRLQTGYRFETTLWSTARPYTGPTRPNWIEWRGGECPVSADARVIYQIRTTSTYMGTAEYLQWSHLDADADIMRYSVVQP